MLVATGRPQYLLYGLLCGYGFAWIGHFVLREEQAGHASSARCTASWATGSMYRDIWTGKIPL